QRLEERGHGTPVAGAAERERGGLAHRAFLVLHEREHVVDHAWVAEPSGRDERVDTYLAIEAFAQRADVPLVLRRLLARHVDERRRGALVAEVAEHLHRDALLRDV